jgi:hypothetical protein
MRAEIVAFKGTWGSGIATLTVYANNRFKILYCDNGPTVRALNALFPGFIAKGHTVNNDMIKGQEIDYELDDMGLCLAYINRVD